MGLVVIHDRNRVEYHAVESDVSSGSVPSATWIGAKLVLTDTGQEYLVGEDLQLIDISTGYATATETVITAGSVSGSLVAENTSRKYLFIQNLSGAEDIHVSSKATATTSSPKIAAGGNQELSGHTLYRGAVTVVKSGSQVVTVVVVEGT